MNLGFHYHSTFILCETGVKVPGQIGMFLSELARQCDNLYLFLEETPFDQSMDHDYLLDEANISLVSIGQKSSFYHRFFFPWKKIKIISSYSDKLDILLLRAPSPMVPLLFMSLHKKVPTWILLVGNYINGISGLKQPLIRKIGIIAILYIYNLIQFIVIKRAKVLVNSKALYNQYANSAKYIKQVKTTTLTSDSFFKRSDTCDKTKIHILYTGRINFQKGLRELIDAVALLINRFDLVLDIVGWEDPGQYSCIKELKARASRNGINERVNFIDKKRIGEELNFYYRNSDIFVLPTYHEGFPRSIWEAMANSIPVICTPVGGIPYELTNRVDARFVKMKSALSLAEGIEEIIVDGSLRRTIIRNAYEKSTQNTVEAQTVILLDEMKKLNGKE